MDGQTDRSRFKRSGQSKLSCNAFRYSEADRRYRGYIISYECYNARLVEKIRENKCIKGCHSCWRRRQWRCWYIGKYRTWYVLSASSGFHRQRYIIEQNNLDVESNAISNHSQFKADQSHPDPSSPIDPTIAKRSQPNPPNPTRFKQLNAKTLHP